MQCCTSIQISCLRIPLNFHSFFLVIPYLWCISVCNKLYLFFYTHSLCSLGSGVGFSRKILEMVGFFGRKRDIAIWKKLGVYFFGFVVMTSLPPNFVRYIRCSVSVLETWPTPYIGFQIDIFKWILVQSIRT